MGVQTESVMNPAYNEMFDEKSAQSESTDQVVEEHDEKAEESDASEKEESQEETKSAEEESKEDEKSDDDEKEEDKEPEGDEEEKPKRKSGIQKRINKLNARVQAARDDAEYWRQEALKNRGSKSSDDEVSEDDSQKALSAKPVSDDYETYDEYMEALADFKAEEKLKAYKEAAEAEKANQSVDVRLKSHNERVDAYREENPGFDEALNDFFEDHGDDFALSMVLQEAITESELGPQLLHELAQDPEEFDRINTLGVTAAAKAIGRLESKIEAKVSSSKEEKKEAKPKSTTKAPPPLQAIKAKGATATKDPMQMSQKEYEAWRMSKK